MDADAAGDSWGPGQWKVYSSCVLLLAPVELGALERITSTSSTNHLSLNRDENRTGKIIKGARFCSCPAGTGRDSLGSLNRARGQGRRDRAVLESQTELEKNLS